MLNIHVDATLRYKCLSTYPYSLRFDGLITVCLVLVKHVTKHKTENNLGNIVVQYRLWPSLVPLLTNPQPEWADFMRGPYY